MHDATLLLTAALIVVVAYYLLASPEIKRNGRPLKWVLLGSFSSAYKCDLQIHCPWRVMDFFSYKLVISSSHGSSSVNVYLDWSPSKYMCQPPGVVINDPKNLEYVLKNEDIFAKSDFFKKRSWDLFGNGIINADGDQWKVQRKAGLHFLSASNLKALTDLALPRYLEDTVRRLKKVTNESIDLEAEFHELTTQLMGRMAYNMDMHNTDSFSTSFDYASGKIGERFQNPLWQITEIFSGQRFRKAASKVKSFGNEIVANAVIPRAAKSSEVATIPRDGNSLDTMAGSLINSLLDSIDDHQMVADAALNYLSAGRDTTAQALTWTFYLLMRRPLVLTKIRKEISQANLQSPPDLELDSSIYRPAILPYTTATFYETLRLYPPVPFELKQCTQSTTLPDGTFLPASAILVWCTWAMNRSSLIWGSDSLEFKPERWLENGNLMSRPASEYPVFNGGPRTCLGKKMAELVAVQVIARLVMGFEFTPVDDGERRSRNSLTLPMEGGLPCFVTVREQAIREAFA